MNVFDKDILNFFNHYSHHSLLFDTTIRSISGSNFFKGGISSIVIWWAWFHHDERQAYVRERVIATVFSSVLGVVIARFLALTLPFRTRPMLDSSVHFIVPYGMHPNDFVGWSSFPSDHAAFFYALATGLVFISRKLGFFALLYTTFFIALPRIYLGEHYPTDILVGTVIGVSLAVLCNLYLDKVVSLKKISNLSQSIPGLFYPLFFLFTYEMTDMFGDVRELGSAAFHVIKGWMG